MGFDEAREDPWRGRGDGSHSRMNFLRVAVKCGAVQTGWIDGDECPYYGAHEHAESLTAEGLLKKYDPDEPFTFEQTIWIPTTLGKVMVA